jgi:hypothetical protein
MDQANPLTDKIRTWFERSPKAQRAYQRLSADLDTVVDRVDAATSDLQKRVAPFIDPVPQAPVAAASTPTMAESGGAPRPDDAEETSDSVIPESESSVPPGVKKDGEPVDPTT